jgi:hypothetical protein
MLSRECAPSAQPIKPANQPTAAQAIVMTREIFPDLSGDGIRLYPGAAPQAIHDDQVHTAITFLKLLRPTRRPTIGSGTLKHHVEDWGAANGLCAYISRGATIAAAIALGYPVRAYRYGADVQIGVSTGDLKKLNDKTLELRIKRRERRAALNDPVNAPI